MKRLLLTFITVVVYATTVLSFQGYENYILDKNSKVSKEESYLIVINAVKVAKLYKFDSIWIMSIMKVESNYNKRAIGRKASGKAQDYGLMQINGYWWIKNWHKNNLKKLEIIKRFSDLFKIDKNILGGTHILNVKRDYCINKKRLGRLKKRMTITKCTVQAYNGYNIPNYYELVIKALFEIEKNYLNHKIKVSNLINKNEEELGVYFGFRLGIVKIFNASRGGVGLLKSTKDQLLIIQITA